MKKILLWCLLATMSVTLVSCDDDDDNKVGSARDLIGEWVLVASEGYDKYDGRHGEDSPWKNTYNVVTEVETVEFREDGKAIFTERYGEDFSFEYTWEGNWSFSGNQLKITFEDEGDNELSTVIELTASRLVTTVHSVEEEDGIKSEYFEKRTYTKK